MLTFALPARRKAGFGLLPIHYRMMALGLTRRESVGLVNQITTWLRSRGPKGYLEIVARHKQAWQDREIGQNRVIPGLMRVGKGKLPLQTAMLHRLSIGNRFRILKLLKNLIRYEEAQPEQWLKFYNSATRPQPEKQWLKYYSRLCVLGSTVYPNKDELSFEAPTPVTELADDPGNKTFSPFDSRTSVPRDPEKVLVDSLKAAKLYTCLKQVVPLFETNYRDTSIPKTVGLIGVTQEPGGKGRFFASVHPVWQAYFTPLQAALKYRANRDPGGCVRDQDRGRSLVARMLGLGKEVFTFDLSDATNVFPLVLQSAWMLEAGINHHQVHMFESISRSPFMVSQEIHDLFGADTLTFTVGQPLGLLPSAMAFHLTHIYLLRGIEFALYGRNRDMFSVLVDDVCIWDKTLADEYRLACDRLGITISEAKSFRSSRFSEYLGRLITPNKIHELTTQSPLSFDNALPYIRVMGPRIIREVKDRRVRNFLTSVSSLPSPLGADCGNGISRSLRMTSRIGKLALVESSTEMKEVKPMGCVTTRVRALLKIARHTTEMVLSSEVLTYLSKLLPRRKSKVAEAHYSHPKLGTLWRNSRGTDESWYLESSEPGVLRRTSDTYDALRQWREPNFAQRRKSEVKIARVYLSSLMKSYLRD